MSLFCALGSWDVCGGVGCGLQARIEWVCTPVVLASHSSVVRWQSLRAVLARYGLLCYSPTGPSLVHIVRVGCDTVGFFHKEGPVRC